MSSTPIYPPIEKHQRPTWESVERFGPGHEVFRDLRLNPRQWLYRYMSAEKALLTFSKRTLWFADPRKWDDPHESWWCRHLFTEDGHLPGARVFGSCWTMRWRDEPNWRMHTSSNGVLPPLRVRVRAEKLTRWLHQMVRDSTSPAKAFIGLVQYSPLEELVAISRQLRRGYRTPQMKQVARIGAEALLMKRLAYVFEHEVRMLWLDSATLGTPPGIELPFDTTDLFDQVMIGPSKSPQSIATMRGLLIALGVSEDQIKESMIWATPEDEIKAEQEREKENQGQLGELVQSASQCL